MLLFPIFLITVILTGVWYILWLAFSWWLMTVITLCTHWTSICLCWKNVYVDLLSMFQSDCLGFCYWVVSSSLYILNINPLADIWLANIFPHSVGCFFILLMVSFAVKTLFSLMQSYLFIFAFVTFAIGVKSKKLSPRAMPRRLLPMCFLQEFL